jgi:hypothetical protein
MNSTEKEIAKPEITKLIRQVTTHIEASKHAWERANDRETPDNLRPYFERKENKRADEIKKICDKFGIEIYWPGLYPAFKVNGYEEHSFENAILAALKLPRNFLRE